jgi:hypothetical protein
MLFNAIERVSTVEDINHVISKWDPLFIHMIIDHFNYNCDSYSIIIGLKLEKIKHKTATNALYAIAMMTSAKMFMRGHLQRLL